MYKKAGYRLRRRPAGPAGAVVLTQAEDDSSRLSRAVADSSLGPVGRRTARRHTPGIRVGLLPQGDPGAAGHHGLGHYLNSTTIRYRG